MRELDMPFKEVSKEEMDHLVADTLFGDAIFISRTRFLRILPMTITIARLSTKAVGREGWLHLGETNQSLISAETQLGRYDIRAAVPNSAAR